VRYRLQKAADGLLSSMMTSWTASIRFTASETGVAILTVLTIEGGRTEIARR
jgi:hypothetical protein